MSEFTPIIGSNHRDIFTPFMMMRGNGEQRILEPSAQEMADPKEAIDQAYHKGMADAQQEFHEQQDEIIKSIERFLAHAQKQLELDCHLISQAIMQHMRLVAQALNLCIENSEGDILQRIENGIKGLNSIVIEKIKLHPKSKNLWPDISKKTGIQIEPYEESEEEDFALIYADGFLEDRKSDRIAMFRGYFDACDTGKY